MFTQGQWERMLAAANSLAGNRWHLWQPDNLIATGTDDESWNNNPYAEVHQYLILKLNLKDLVAQDPLFLFKISHIIIVQKI